MKSRILFLWIAALILISANLQAQEPTFRWQTFDGPYWVNGIDVAYGSSGQLRAWHRYLIGQNANDSIYYWWPGDNRWSLWDNLPAANKIISYKMAGDGYIAFCSAYGDDIWRSTDGGYSWIPSGFPTSFNKHFSSVEVPLYGDFSNHSAQNIVMVATEGIQNLSSTYYTENGSDWAVIGGTNSTINFAVNDIECIYAPNDDPNYSFYPPPLSMAVNAVGTSLYGIYVKDHGSWDSPWVGRNFQGLNVPVLENIDNWPDMGPQIAAVEQGAGGLCNLYYSGGGGDDFDYWWTEPVEIKVGGDSFRHKVRDMAAVYWGASDISLYVATDEGIHLLTFTVNNIGITATEVTLPYPPLTYDTDIQAVDCRFVNPDPPDVPTAYVLVATKYNIYQIEEARESPIPLTVTEVVAGTYLSNLTGISYPSNSTGQQKVFSVSNNGIIKSHDVDQDPKWQMVGTAFEIGGTERIGTDVATDEGTSTLVSSKGANDGRVMYSPDAGTTWQYHNIENSYTPIINSVCFDPVQGLNLAFAAGLGDGDNGIWHSTDDCQSWSSIWTLNSPTFNEVIPDWITELGWRYIFAGGSGSVKAAMYNGTTWSTIQDGLNAVTSVNQLAVATIVNPSTYNHSVYAATNGAVYKINDFLSTQTWYKHDYGTGVVNIGSIVADPYWPYDFLAGTSPEAQTPMIWASGDSARSWNQLYNGALEADDAIVNKLEASQAGDVGNSQFVVGTDRGSYYLRNPFRHGPYGSEIWGPGIVIVNGDVTIDGNLTIIAPCTVYVVYNFDTTNRAGEDPNRSGIYIYGGLTALGGQNAPILFTSSKPTNKAAGDWTGIVFMKPGVGSPVNMSYCTIEYAVKGIFDFPGPQGSPVHSQFDMLHCTVQNMTIAGLDLFSTSSGDPGMSIANCLFDRCGSYGIMIRKDDVSSNRPAVIGASQILDCSNGISYCGNGDASGAKYLKIKDCIIARRISGSGNYGLWLKRYSTSPGTFAPTYQIINDSISYFAQSGIFLDKASSITTLTGNKVKRNGEGLTAASSSPNITGTSENDFNAFCYNTMNGIHYDKYSGGMVRWALIKRNTINGVLIDSHDATGAPIPNFGSPDQGHNSIHKDSPLPNQYDMRNNRGLVAMPFWGWRIPLDLVMMP